MLSKLQYAALGLVMLGGLVMAEAGGQERGGGFGGPGDFLQRLDANGNRMIDPEEAEGRMGFFLRRLAENNPRIDLSRPIPLETLSQEFERMRREGGFGGRGRRDDDDDDDDRDRRRGRDSRLGPSPEIEPLVPGFGLEAELPPVLGFGERAEWLSVPVSDEDRREAEERFRRYDRNRDSYLEREEIGRERWRDNPFAYDGNGDGRLTVAELAVRYARRRMDEQEERRGSAGNSEDRSAELRERFSRFRREDGEQRGRWAARGFEPAGQDGSGWGGRGLDAADREESRAERPNAAEQVKRSYRFATPLERLPSGLPAWFALSDRNGDAQVMMSEFATDWTAEVAFEFMQFDLDRDGIITAPEALEAISNGAQRGSTVLAPAASTSEAAPPASGDAELSEMDAKQREYFAELVKKYDGNGDGALTANEWSQMAKSPAVADTDGDGRVTILELARWKTK